MKTTNYLCKNLVLLASCCHLLHASSDVDFRRFLFIVRSEQDLKHFETFSQIMRHSDTSFVSILCSEIPLSEQEEVTKLPNMNQDVSGACPLQSLNEAAVFRSISKNFTVYRTSRCSSYFIDLLSLFLVVHYSRTHSFFIPVSSLEMGDIETWRSLIKQFYVRYATKQEVRRFWANYSSNSHLHRLIDVLQKRSFTYNEEDLEQVLSDCSSSKTPKANKHFVYLATAENKEDITFELNLVNDDSDALFCIWGQPPPTVDLECQEKCHEEIHYCRQVCRDRLETAQSVDRHPFQYIYVRGSSFQEGRNFLLQEARLRGNYSYFVFMVDDMIVNHRNFQTGLVGNSPFRKLLILLTSCLFLERSLQGHLRII